MNIIYTCDNNFVWIMGISMISLFENNKEIQDIHVYLLGDGISSENKDILESIAKQYNRVFTLIDVPDLNIPEKLSSSRWPKSAFTRMFAGNLMPTDIEKVIYLDCDTIINGSIEELNGCFSEDNAVSGVKDCVSRPYKNKIGIVENGSYINAGVLLLNLTKLRKLDISAMIASFIEKYESAISYADQDILNGIFQGVFGIVPPQYDLMTLVSEYTYDELRQLRHPDNYYTELEIRESKENPRIIHYTTCMLNIRPWCQGSKHTYAHLFDTYQRMSPWAEREKSIANFTSKEYKVIKLIQKLPPFLANRVLGLIHAYLRPYYIMFMAKFKK